MDSGADRRRTNELSVSPAYRAFAAIDRATPPKAPSAHFRPQKDWLFWIDVRGSGNVQVDQGEIGTLGAAVAGSGDLTIKAVVKDANLSSGRTPVHAHYAW